MKRYIPILSLSLFILSCNGGGSSSSLTQEELDGLQEELTLAADSIDYSTTPFSGVYICRGGGIISYDGTSAIGATTTAASATMDPGSTTASIANCTTEQGIIIAGDISYLATGPTGGALDVSLNGPNVTVSRADEEFNIEPIKDCFMSFSYTEGDSDNITGNVCGEPEEDE